MPLAAGYLIQYLNWRWIFWTVSIADALVQILAFLFLPETYAPKILSNKAKKLRKETENAKLHTEYEDPGRTFGKTLRTALVRPFVMLFTQPALQVTALYRAYLYGLMYLVLSTFPELWTNVYHESIGISGLNYISLGLGFFLGTQIGAPFNDWFYRRLKARNNGVGRPEFRVPLMFPGSILIPIGLFWYGWSAEAKVFWIMPNIGAAIFAAGTILVVCLHPSTLIPSNPRG